MYSYEHIRERYDKNRGDLKNLLEKLAIKLGRYLNEALKHCNKVLELAHKLAQQVLAT